MDKRKQKLLLQLDQIVDEQNSLAHSIEREVSQLKVFVSNCDGEVDHKQVQAVLHYVIQVLQKLSDMNFDWETLSSENPLAKVAQTETVPNNQPSTALALTKTAPSSEPNIEALKNNLLEFSKKLCINENSLSSIKDYYAKPSSSITEETAGSKCSQYETADTQLATNTAKTEQETASHSSQNTKKHEIPEKLCNWKVSEEQTDFLVDLRLKPEENLVKDTTSSRPMIEINDKETPSRGTLCAFSYIKNPSEFYLHLIDDDCHYLDDMTDLIAMAVSENSLQFRSKEEAHAYIVRYCFAQVKNEWYRAQVLEWNLDQNADKVKVHLIDFGSKEFVSYRKIRVLTETFTKIPKLALRCHLPWLYPSDYSNRHRNTKWPPDVIKTFEKIASFPANSSSNVNLFTLDYVAKRGESFAVDLHQDGEDPENTIGSILLRLNQAKQIVDMYGEDVELEDFLEDYDAEEPENVNEAIVGYDAKDEARICRFTRPDGTCFKGKNCNLEHVPIAKDGFTTDVIPVHREAFTELLLPQKTETVYILITAYINSCAFYAQIIRTQCKNKKYVVDEDFQQLMHNMKQQKSVSKYVKHKVAPAIGEVVIIKYWTDHWLRATVRELIWNERGDFVKAEVFLVDYGELCQVQAKNIREMNETFLQLPFQAVECYLSNVQEKKNVDQKRAIEFFKENIEYRNFMAHIMSSTIPIRMVVMSLNGVEIAEKLTELDLAEPRQFNVQPADDATIRPH